MTSTETTHIVGKMEEVIVRADYCSQDMNHCCELLTKLAKLKQYEQKGEKVKAILMLQAYGSKDKFMDKIEQSKAKFKEDSESLSTLIEELKKMLEAKSYDCPTCNGNGNLVKWEYQRERDFIQPVQQSYPCETCGGKGRLAIPSDAELHLPLFLQLAHNVIETQRHFWNALENLTGQSI